MAPCTMACENIDDCGLLAQYGLDVDGCFEVCVDSYTPAQVTWAIAATCAELEQALGQYPPPTPCAQLCNKLDGCGLLEATT